MKLEPLQPETLYTVKELAFRWGVDDETVRRAIRDEPGVLAITTKKPGQERTRPVYRIPGKIALKLEAEWRI